MKRIHQPGNGHRIPSMLLVLLLPWVATGAGAQKVPLSFEASPEVYRVVAENASYRVIEATWAPGQRDALHAHPMTALYTLTNCQLRQVQADGSTRDVAPDAGFAVVQAPIASHWVQNIGSAPCRMVMFEPK